MAVKRIGDTARDLRSVHYDVPTLRRVTGMHRLQKRPSCRDIARQYLHFRFYSQANLPHHQTSAKRRSPRVPLDAGPLTATRFSKVYSAPVASCPAGVG